jgi:hypothetical protein
MTQETQTTTQPPKTPRKQRTLIAVGASLIIALVCFTVAALLPPPKKQFLDDPLRSFLIGVGVLGVASPLCISGFSLQKKFSSSPYFEGAFIASVLTVFGLLCVAVGLVCIGFGVYDLIRPFLANR